MIHDPQRVSTLRERASNMLGLISALESTIHDEGLIGQLHLIGNWVSDVESFFIRPLERDQRTPEQEKTWLDGADVVLHMASGQFAVVRRIIEERGPNVTTVG